MCVSIRSKPYVCVSISGFQPLKNDFVAHSIMTTNTSAFKAQRSITLRNTPTHPRSLNSNLRCSQRASLPFVQAVASHVILRKYIRRTLATANGALCPNTHTYTLVHTAQSIITVIITHTPMLGNQCLIVHGGLL